MKRTRPLPVLAAFIIAATAANGLGAAEVHVAVASNFKEPMRGIAAAFERETGHRAVLCFGATGKFYAQISQGAPYDMLLAADQAVPTMLVKEHLALPGTRFTYATGKLALWSASKGYVDGQGSVLHNGRFAHLALANPKTAPYGAAAVDTLRRLGRLGALQARLVQGENIAQAYQLTSTGNAELGFVALPDVYRDGKFSTGSGWIVPESLHAPILQDLVILARGGANPAARALRAYLASDQAAGIIRSYGYER